MENSSIIKSLTMLKLLSSIILGFILSLQLIAQDTSMEERLILNKEIYDYHFEGRKVHFNQLGNKSLIAKYNPVTLLANSLLFTYQQLFSVQISASCLYHPSCSEYSKQLIKDFGLIKGVSLSADRLTRCNRIAATDIHPLKVNEKILKVEESTNVYRIKSED